MDSIICVAVITNLFCARAMRIMRFCRPGTAASPTSTPKSPRATMMASEASMMAAKLSMASARSILAMMLAWPPACLTRLLANSTSAAVLGKDMAMKSASNATAVLMSTRSFLVKASADKPPPWRLMPLLLLSTPPLNTRQWIWLPLTRSTCMLIRPSSNSKITPSATSFGKVL